MIKIHAYRLDEGWVAVYTDSVPHTAAVSPVQSTALDALRAVLGITDNEDQDDVVHAVDEVQDLATVAAPVRGDGGRLRWHCTGCHAVFEQWKVNEFHGPYYEDGDGRAHSLRGQPMTWAELAEQYVDCVGRLVLERA